MYILVYLTPWNAQLLRADKGGPISKTDERLKRILERSPGADFDCALTLPKLEKHRGDFRSGGRRRSRLVRSVRIRLTPTQPTDSASATRSTSGLGQ